VLPPLDAAQLAAFEFIKELLTSTLILALPRRKSLFIRDTAACAVQVGCTLRQQQADKAFSRSATTAGASSWRKKTTRQPTENA